MKNSLSFSYVHAELSAYGIDIRKTGLGSECQVRVKKSPSGEGYFSDDLNDCFQTGKLMARSNKFESETIDNNLNK